MGWSRALWGGRSLRWEESGRLIGDLVHLGEDGFETFAVVDPLPILLGLLFGEASAGGLAVERCRPLPIRPVELGRVGVAPAAGIAAGHMAPDDTALENPADLGELPDEPAVALGQGVAWP